MEERLPIDFTEKLIKRIDKIERRRNIFLNIIYTIAITTSVCAALYLLYYFNIINFDNIINIKGILYILITPFQSIYSSFVNNCIIYIFGFNILLLYSIYSIISHHLPKTK